MAKLYADEDCSYPVVQQLRQLGRDVLTAHEASQANQGIEDRTVVMFATAAGRVLVTFNRCHFIRLHSEVSLYAGIIVCTRDDHVVALAKRIHVQLQSSSALHGQLLRITRPASQQS